MANLPLGGWGPLRLLHTSILRDRIIIQSVNICIEAEFNIFDFYFRGFSDSNRNPIR